jgi:hypothetical protein
MKGLLAFARLSSLVAENENMNFKLINRTTELLLLLCMLGGFVPGCSDSPARVAYIDPGQTGHGLAQAGKDARQDQGAGYQPPQLAGQE